MTIQGVTATGFKTTAITKTISVPYKGVNVQLKLSGGNASLLLYRDGVALERKSVGYPIGYTKTVVGNRSVCVFTNNPFVVYLSINGANPVKMANYTGGLKHAMIDSKGVRGVASCF